MQKDAVRGRGRFRADLRSIRPIPLPPPVHRLNRGLRRKIGSIAQTRARELQRLPRGIVQRAKRRIRHHHLARLRPRGHPQPRAGYLRGKERRSGRICGGGAHQRIAQHFKSDEITNNNSSSSNNNNDIVFMRSDSVRGFRHWKLLSELWFIARPEWDNDGFRGADRAADPIYGPHGRPLGPPIGGHEAEGDQMFLGLVPQRRPRRRRAMVPKAGFDPESD